MKRRVVVVGAGPGGLSAAMLLAHRGFDVTVLEKGAREGGRTGSIRLGPYTFDTGSTLLMMRFVLEELFEVVGRRLRDHVDVMPLDPMYRLHFGEGHLDVYSNPQRMASELERFEPGSSEGLARFLCEEQRRLGHLYPLMQRDWPSLGSMLAPSALAAAPRFGLLRSLHATAARYFASEELRLAFSFQSAYLGMSPWECPGGFAMVPYVEHAYGVDHVRGGIHRVCGAMRRVAEQDGARVRTNTPVRRIVLDGDRATGVELESGERVEADEVIAAADASYVLRELLDRDVAARFSRRRVTRLRGSCSTFMLYLGLDRRYPLPHHSFFFARDYAAEMRRLFGRGEVGEDLSLYVCNPAASDDTMAPPGHSALYALVLVPNLRADVDWTRLREPLRARVLSLLECRAGLDGLAAHVRACADVTPEDWRRRFLITDGAVFGPTHNVGQLLAFRPPNRLPGLRNVCLAGGGTNPGSGLPTILESGRIAARIVCERAGVPMPAPAPLPPALHVTVPDDQQGTPEVPCESDAA